MALQWGMSRLSTSRRALAPSSRVEGHASAALCGLLLLITASPATALPVLVVDADPVAPGVQAARSVALGASFEVAVLIEGVDASQPLHAFQLGLAHSETLVGSAVAPADFLAEPLLVIVADPTGMVVELAVTRLASEGYSGSGTLAIVEFLAVALGTSPLTLEGVVLSQPFGVPLPFGQLQGASIQVVPEATTWLLVLTGLALIAASARLRRSA